ncbi:tautomerase family protein [Streptodolium elevatio]|uniref:4-oxalocrotonate tautomerase n=1 Tax=Streptodolium elevatio TaxID=3157996 RepID=A0ABV3DMR1_9ACTN
MPMLDAYIPSNALPADVERELLAELTDILLRNEGADPTDVAARSIAWVFLHRPETVYVAGAPADEPRYRFVATVPQGQFDDSRRAKLVAEVTAAVLAAEGTTDPRAASRVWVFATEMPDGTWGGAGRINRLADIAGYVLGDPQAGAEYAAKRLAESRA